MKVLWICNVMPPVVCQDMRIQESCFGGWVAGTLDSVINIQNDNFQLAICCPAYETTKVIHGVVRGLNYYCFPSEWKRDTDTEWYKQWFVIILDDYKPDILHIYGTEYAHSIAAATIFSNPDRTLVNIQGICSECAKYYFEGLPLYISHGFSLRDILRRDTLMDQRNSFIARGKNEIALLRSVGHISGRTDWDKACASQINPDAQYHFCNETLRQSFYYDRWQAESCESHSIFASSSSYPIKGFHFLLEAMPEILKRYPDAKVYVTGKNPFDIPRYKLTSYTWYLRKLIVGKGLKNRIVFCGTLDEGQMKDRYLKSNVFVLPSSIENSPNSLGEAMLLGVPCVAADVGGVTNLMTHGQDGFVYQHNEITMLAYYVCRIFENKTLAQTLSENAALHAKKTHNPRVNANTLINIYENINR